MSKQRLAATIVLVASVLILALVLVLQFSPSPKPAMAGPDRDSIISYQTVTLFDGSTPYSDTQYSTAYLGAGFAHLQIHAIQATAITTQVITYTPQFSLEPVGCGAITAGWFGAGTWSGGTKTDVYLALTSTVANGREIPMEGRCVRVKLSPSQATAYTPTLYIRMLNK